MVRVVSDQIAEESGDVWAKSLYSAIAFERRLQHRAQSCPALLQRFRRLGRSYAGAIELLGNLASFGGGFQPHHADVVQVSHDTGDAPSLAFRRRSAPGFGRQVFDHVVVDTVVGVE